MLLKCISVSFSNSYTHLRNLLQSLLGVKRICIFLGVQKMLVFVLISPDNLKHCTTVLQANSQLMHDTEDGRPEECLNLAQLPIEIKSKYAQRMTNTRICNLYVIIRNSSYIFFKLSDPAIIRILHRI